MSDWINAELMTLDCGDRRLNERGKKLLHSLQEAPNASFPQACGGWGDTQGSYRFFNNPKVDAQTLLSPHIESTQTRMQSHDVVLCIEDSSFINHEGQRETPGLGPHSSPAEYGYFIHPLLAVTPEKLCLGTLKLHSWVRDGKFGRRSQPRHKPIEEKESYRWLQGFRHVQALQPDFLETQLVYVADREADIYELLSDDLSGDTGWLIRAVRNRKTTQTDKIRDQLNRLSPLGKLTLSIGKQKKRKGRTAALTVYSQRMTLLGARRSKPVGKLPDAEVTAILAVEHNPPKGETPIEWLLLTNLTADTFGAACEKLHWYSCRWQIEIFFYTLKRGCLIEKLQLKTKERLLAAVALYMIVTWRLMYMNRLARILPDIDAEQVFKTIEWQLAYQQVYRRVPTTVPSLRSMIKTVAQLGGYLNRKNDSPPGVKTLWLGLQKLQALLEGYELAQTLL